MVGAVAWGVEEGELVITGNRVSVVQDEKSSGDGCWWWLHNIMNVLNVMELFPEKQWKWSILCYVYFTMITTTKKGNLLKLWPPWGNKVSPGGCGWDPAQEMGSSHNSLVLTAGDVAPRALNPQAGPRDTWPLCPAQQLPQYSGHGHWPLIRHRWWLASWTPAVKRFFFFPLKIDGHFFLFSGSLVAKDLLVFQFALDLKSRWTNSLELYLK